ncbi:MAG: GNAT family N-acetyltransferase [Deltaproteobacteria bacterium]|nr:GNAT family N-acetyltransferase [Deltaproteobacteria bacterium]
MAEPRLPLLRGLPRRLPQRAAQQDQARAEGDVTARHRHPRRGGRGAEGGALLIFAERDSKIIAGTLNVQDGAALYGRYWGSFVEERYLHFNVCYYSAIEHCIRHGLKRFEAGAGGSFKQLRGLDPEPTRSLHYIVDGGFRRVVVRHLSQEREAIERKRAGLLEKSQLKDRGEGNRQ